MGGKQTKPVNQLQELKSSHPLFANAKVAKDQQGYKILSRVPVQAKAYDQWKNAVIGSQPKLDPQFLLLPEHTGFTPDKEMCSTTGTALNTYPHFPINLADEIARRKPEKEYFKEADLWYLFYALIASKRDLKAHGGNIGDVRPGNVFIDEKQHAKVANLYSSPLSRSAFQLAKEDQQTPYLLAPQDLAQLAKNAIDNKSNPKSEVFSIGATVISAGILDDLSQAYNYKNYAFDDERWSRLKEQWVDHPKYSEIFKSIVLNLVNEDPNKRITIQQLYVFVAKYGSSIKSKEQFIITHPPENLQTGVSIVRSRVK